MTSVLTIESLTKTYRHGARANDGLALSAEAGEVYGVLGHNGAGKTTLVNQVVGLLKPDAGIANLITQVLVVFVLMFSPLNFPPERLPDWLAAIHSVLPIQAMGEVIRGTVAGNAFPMAVGPFLLLGAWCAVAFGLTGLVLTRRR
ncbi:MAG TPA: ATP-binding cassette domain-containing protein [Candidatus Limnocylindrales bacterium]|nr:ATP-binding cassette domain-containing protein [Candidatus Limnocylindrales bacterium]